MAPDSGVHWLTPLASGLALLAAAGGSIGLASWAWRNDPERVLMYAFSNDLAPQGRSFALGNMAAGSAAGLFVGLIVALFLRRRGGPALTLDLGRRLAPLILTGLLPWVTQPRLWAGRELTMLLAIALVGVGLQKLTRTALATPPIGRRIAPSWLVPAFDRGRRLRNQITAAAGRATWLPWIIVGAAVVAYAVHFAHHTLLTHYRLGTGSFDLGLEDNRLWNAVHRGKLFLTMPSAGPGMAPAPHHQTYFAYLLAPIYALFPHAQTLLVIQAVLIALAAIPLFLLTRKRLGDLTGVVLALGYLLYPPLHGPNLYGFHYQPLAAVFLFTLLHLLRERRDVAAAITMLLCFSVHEDVAVVVAVIGAFLILTGERPVAGLVVAVCGLLTFGTLKFVIMPRFAGGAEPFVAMYKELLGPEQQGPGGVLETVLANPFFTLGTLVEPQKLIYVLQILGPLAFLPLRRGIGWLCCVPGFVFTLLATQSPPLQQISFQYTAWWTTLLFIGCVAALEQLHALESVRPPPQIRGAFAAASQAANQNVWAARANRPAWLVAFTGALLVSSLQFGAVLGKRNARGGFGPYRFGLTDLDHERHAQAHDLIALVPPDAKIGASEFLVPQVSNRRHAYILRTGAFDADYLLFETPGADSDERDHVVAALRDGAFGVVDVKGPFVLARRGHPTARNAEVMAGFGG